MHGVVESPHGIDTPRVAELPWGDKTPGVTTEGEGVPGEDGRGQGGDGNPPHHPSNQGERRRRWRQGDDGRAGEYGAAAPTAGNGGGQRQSGDPSQAYHRHLWRPLANREYSLLAPRMPAVALDVAGDQGSGDSH